MDLSLNKMPMPIPMQISPGLIVESMVHHRNRGGEYDGTCNPLHHQPIEKVETFQNYALYRNLSQLSNVTGDFETPLAICKLDMRDGSGWMVHFPHVMQHLYACYSYWMEHPSKIPVLHPVGVGKATLARRHDEYPFLKGFIELIESQMGVQIMNELDLVVWLLEREYTLTVESAVEGGSSSSSNERRVVLVKPKMVEFHRPLGYVFSRPKNLNQMAMQQYNIDGGINPVAASEKKANTRLKIGILNRRASSGRSITNVDDIVQRIQIEIEEAEKDTGSNITIAPFAQASPQVSVEYFEGKNNLEEQVRFFNSIDILVSPHGAQLTGLPFMANKDCRQLIEFFPDRYYMPDFYGSLAIDSGIGYSHVYFSDETVDEQSRKYSTAVFQRVVTPNIKKRTKHRAQNLCVDSSVVVDAIRKAILDWGRCQEQLGH